MDLLEPVAQGCADARSWPSHESARQAYPARNIATRITSTIKLMTQKQLNGAAIDVDDEGYMTNHAQWNRDVAAALAKEEGIELTEAHWKILDFIDKDFRQKSAVPGMRRMNKVGGIE